MTVALFDPSLASENLGDEIIFDAVTTHISALLPTHQIIRLPTQEIVGARTRRIAREADYRIVGGTNLLSSKMLAYRQWQVGLLDAFRQKPVILMGVGWWQYQEPPDTYTRALLRRILSRSSIHSVRDSYTATQLQRIGIENVINTGCPTLWELEDTSKIPNQRSSAVVFTLTDYKPSPDRDRALIAALRRLYTKIYFWPQGAGDMKYLNGLGSMDSIRVINPSLRAYDDLLRDEWVDFVGTRLHGGIRALQRKRRAVIIAVDNRASELGRDTGLPVTTASTVDQLTPAIAAEGPISISIPVAGIRAWKAQFTGDNGLGSPAG